MNVIVYNLTSDEEWHYTIDSGLPVYEELEERVRVLVNTYMLENKMSSQLYNTVKRDLLINTVISGRKYFALGDYCIAKQ